MNLPLQMRAVSRRNFSKSRAGSSAGRVLPSWKFVCDQVACSCPDGSVVCCGSSADCTCGNTPTQGNGPAACSGFGNPGKKHPRGAIGHWFTPGPIDCSKDAITCFAVDNTAEKCLGP
jgi:hypothetical protein